MAEMQTLREVRNMQEVAGLGDREPKEVTSG